MIEPYKQQQTISTESLRRQAPKQVRSLDEEGAAARSVRTGSSCEKCQDSKKLKPAMEVLSDKQK
jgi:hypothetical protein